MKLNNIEVKIISIILAISPILDPYVIVFDVKIMEILVLLAVFWIFIRGLREITYNKIFLFLILTIAICTLLSFGNPYVSVVSDRDALLAFKSIISWGIYFVIISILWTHFNISYFVKYATNIAIFAALFMYIQFFLSFIGITPPDGKIPFLNLSSTDGWAPLVDVTGVLRLHSIFQEPSYMAMYILPIVAVCIINKKYLTSAMLTISILLTTSTLAIAGIIIIILWYVFINFNRIHKIILFLLLLIITHLLLYIFVDPYKELFEYTLQKFMQVPDDLRGERLGSSKIRIIGYLPYYFDFPFYYKLFGVGANQFSFYLSAYNVVQYSSTFVMTILNYGLVGVAVLIYFFISIILKAGKRKFIFALLFIAVCFIDRLWFNWYFFYLLTFVFSMKNYGEIQSD